MELLSLTHSQGAVKTTEDAMAKQYEFWSTQPVPKISMILLYCKLISIHIHVILFLQMKILLSMNLLSQIHLRQKFVLNHIHYLRVLFGILCH
jgi:hypothetical protein